MTRDARIVALERRIRRLETTLGTLIAWIAGSATSPISQDEAAQLLRRLDAAAPEAK